MTDPMVAIVTGGGSGIGRAIAVRLGREGASVGIIDRDRDRAESTAQAIADLGGTARAEVADIADHDAVGAAVASIAHCLGAVNALVNNAGWDHFLRFVDSTPSLWRQLIDINFVGFLNLHHHVLPMMAEYGGGRIVNIASDAGRVGSSLEAVYSGCKGAMIAFSKTIAREHARDGIRVNCVCPGPTAGALLEQLVVADRSGRMLPALEKAIPLRRVGQPDDFPGIVSFLLGPDADYITGQTISVSGGLTMHG